MCGLTGFWESRERSGNLESVASEMANTLRHRGPDDHGTWVDAEAGLALGHRRLSIFDLSPLGRQPMLSECGRWVIVFNGEVFNFRSLRESLEGRGHAFRGGSDTEVMLAAVREWGVGGAVGRFVGMFAFALWDREERRLHLARDRIGIKPLYYGWCGDTLVFGSELKALRAHPRFEPRVDRGALAQYLRHGYVPAPRSIYEGVRKLPPGRVLSLDRPEDREASPRPYWSLATVIERAEPFRGADEEAAGELDRRLRDAVRLRMEADVPLGAFLSGGIDSSLVAALMQAQSDRPIRTFTIGYRDPRFDEAPAAREIARHLGTEHAELYVEPAHALELVPALPAWYDEPFGDSSQIPTLLLSEMTRRHVTVALSGDGGDELFAGYERYDWADRLVRTLGRIPVALHGALARAAVAVPPAWLDAAVGLVPGAGIPPHPGDKLQKLAEGILAGDGRHPLDDAVVRRLLSLWEEPEALVRVVEEPDGPLDDPDLGRRFPDLVARMQFLDSVSYLPDDVLTKVDRASMAYGLEARVPLLDHRVVELAWTFPASMKIRGGVRKWLLRRLLDRYVPSALVDRPKRGFGVPIDEWLRGPLRPWAESLLDEKRLARDGFFDPRPVRRRWEEHLAGRRSWHYALWAVLMFQAWKEEWLG